MTTPRDPGQPQPTPTWVKVCAALFAAFAVVFVAMHLAGQGFGHHGQPAAQGTPTP